MTQRLAPFLALPLALTACDEQDDPQSTDTGSGADNAYEQLSDTGPRVTAPEVSDGTLTISAENMRFQGPGSVAAGWTTITLENKDPMVHFAQLDRLPEGVDAMEFNDKIMGPFQKAYEHMINGRTEEAEKLYSSFPDWANRVQYFGGPGLTGGQRSSQVTMYLEPGEYAIECYVKTADIFHGYSPRSGELAMVFPLTVTEDDNGRPEPTADTTLVISDEGYSLEEEVLKVGSNTLRVVFDDQTKLETQTGYDVHLVRLRDGIDVDQVAAWMDWTDPDGLETPAPADFVGGLNDMPVNSRAYWTFDLAAGRYAFLAELPDPEARQMLVEFTVDDADM